MHQYFDLVYRMALFTLNALKEAEEQTLEHDREIGPGTTSMVKNLQAIRLQKGITAIGMFSMFESILQDGLNCGDGFVEARRCLLAQNEAALAERFSFFSAAINVLKHGHGRSYQTLLRAGQLPFRIARPGVPLLVEGDITGITTLIDADDKFVFDCAQLIRDVSEVVRKVHPSAAV